MFDGLKNLANLPGLMAKARQMQDRMKTVQEEIAKKQINADAGGGMVEATVNGRLELVKVRIDPTRVKLNDIEMVEDLIVAAVRAAQAKALEFARIEMEKVTAEMGLPPGMMP